jgi:hypothetical protein
LKHREISIVPITNIFSPDGKRLACVAGAGKTPFVVVDGKEGKHYGRVGVGAPIFSPDSRRVAYVAEAGSKWFAVVDGKEGKRYNGILSREGTGLVSRSFDSFSCLCIDDNHIY